MAGHTFTRVQRLKLLLLALVNTTDTNHSLFPCRRFYHLPPQKLCCKVFTLQPALYHISTLGVYALLGVNSVAVESAKFDMMYVDV